MSGRCTCQRMEHAQTFTSSHWLAGDLIMGHLGPCEKDGTPESETVI